MRLGGQTPARTWDEHAVLHLQKKARAWGWHVEQPPTNIHQLNPAELYTEQLHSLRHLRQHPTSGHGLH